MKVCANFGSLLALLALFVSVFSAPEEVSVLKVGEQLTLNYDGHTPLVVLYTAYDLDSRLDFTLWSVLGDLSIEGEIFYSMDMTPSTSIGSIQPQTTTVFRFPDSITEETITEPLDLFIRISGTGGIADTINLVLSDGFYMVDGIYSSNSLSYNYVGTARYFKFFICDSDADLDISMTIFIDDILPTTRLYVSNKVGRPNHDTCVEGRCFIANPTFVNGEYDHRITPDLIEEPGWLYIGVEVSSPSDFLGFGVSATNMYFLNPYPNGYVDQEVFTTDLCMYEFCTVNTEYKIDPTQSVAISAWNNNARRMLLTPLHMTGNIISRYQTRVPYETRNGFIYISKDEVSQLFDEGDEDTRLYFRINNQIPIPYPALGQDLRSGIKFGICQDCEPIYPHAAKLVFKASEHEMSRGRFILPYGAGFGTQPVYTNIQRDQADLSSPLRPIYGFSFRNRHIEPTPIPTPDPEEEEVLTLEATTGNKCQWEFLVSSSYTERTQFTEEDKFDKTVIEPHKSGGGASVEIGPDTISDFTGGKFYREGMTFFGHMYPVSLSAPGVCAEDVNYLYVGDIHELNPKILCGVDCEIEPEMTFRSSQREGGGYYALHLKVTLTDDLKAADSKNFIISVVPNDSSFASILIVGSSEIVFPDPDYDKQILSNGGAYTSKPYVSISGEQYADVPALYFTINFLTSSQVRVKFSREDKVIYQTQGAGISGIFNGQEYMLASVFDATSNNFSQAFFAAQITAKEANKGFEACVSEDMTIKPATHCNGSYKHINIASNMGKDRDTILRDLSTKMENSASFVRLITHPGITGITSTSYAALFGTYIELDGADVLNDVQTFLFDNYGTPIFFKMVFTGKQDGMIRLKPGDNLSKYSDGSANIKVIVCPKFPAIYSDYTSSGCQSDIMYTNNAFPKSFGFKMGKSPIQDTTTTTTLWGALYPNSIRAGGDLIVDFSQSAYLDETINNVVGVSTISTSYSFGSIPAIEVEEGSTQSKNMKFIVQASSLSTVGTIYYSQSEIHPTRLTVAPQYTLSWPIAKILPLEKSLTERIYFGFRMTESGTVSPTSNLKVNVNFVYAPTYSVEPLNYHPGISTSDPLFSFYDITPGQSREIPHGAVSYYFYPFNTIDTDVEHIKEIFETASTFTVLGGSSINDVGNKNSPTQYHSTGKGIQVLTIPTSDIVEDIADPGNYHMYFSVYKINNVDQLPSTISTVVFDIVNTSYTLSQDAPITDSIWSNTGFFKQNTGLDYVPILLNYNATASQASVQFQVETCVLNPLEDGTHMIYYSRYTHNPGPNNSEGKTQLGELGKDLSVKLSDEYRNGYNSFFAIHSGVGSIYQFTLKVDYNEKRPQTTDPTIGYINFVKNKSVTLKVVPMYSSDSRVEDQVLADLEVHFVDASVKNISTTNSCGFLNSGNRPLLSIDGNAVKGLLDQSADGLVPLSFTFEKLDLNTEYIINVVGKVNGFSNSYSPVRLIPGKKITGVDVTPPPNLWYVWLIIALVVVAGIVLLLVYLFVWRPRSIEKKQYQELDEKNDGKAEAIAVEDENNEPLA